MPDSVIETSVVLAPPVGLAALSARAVRRVAVVSSVKVLLGGAAGVAGIVGQRGRHRNQVVGMIERLKAGEVAGAQRHRAAGDLGGRERVGRGVAGAVAERDGAGGNVAVDARQRDRNLRGAGPASRVGRAQCQSRRRVAVVSSVKVLLGGAALLPVSSVSEADTVIRLSA